VSLWLLLLRSEINVYWFEFNLSVSHDSHHKSAWCW
jgi:hypothetical protein